MPMSRAKMRVTSVLKMEGGNEKITMTCVAKSSAYPVDGTDEDNSFALWSPSGDLSITISNPALHGKFTPSKRFYIDFTEAP